MKHLTIAGLLLASAAASAQTSTVGDTYPYGISIRAGVVFPIEKTFSDLYSTSLLGLGVDYTPNRTIIRGGETFFSLDYFTQTLGEKGNVFPLMINQKFFGKGREYGSRTYGFVGVGIVFRDLPSNDTTIGARAGAGLGLSNNVFTEATPFLAGSKNGLSTNGLGLHVGYRF